MSEKPSRIVVIGASAGGLNALVELVSQFSEVMNAAYFVVLHLSTRGISDFLVVRLQRYTSLPCSVAVDGELIRPNHIYIAPRHNHLLVKDDHVLLGYGPEENRWKPSIDVLFRSAAAAYSSRTVGIILTGLLNDGTSGMWAIKRSGGTVIVQDPNEAEYPDMPLSVLSNMEVDYSLRLADMGPVLYALSTIPPAEDASVPPEVVAESSIAERVAIGVEHISPLGAKVNYTCPDCGGGLHHVDGDVIERYRCHIGHSYSEDDLRLKQLRSIEATLWIALRIIEERKKLLMKMANDSKQKGHMRVAEDNQEKARGLEEHISILKGVLFSTQNSD